MAVEITQSYEVDEGWAVNIDFNREEYCVCWAGHWEDMPDLTDFPSLQAQPTTATTTSTTTVSVPRIPHSDQVHAVWAKSKPICYGADSHIRLLDAGHEEA